MTPEFIIIHCSATKDSGTVSWQAIRHYHIATKRWRDIGYHLGVERVRDEHEGFLGRPLDARGAHCKAQGMNSRSIGVCIVGDYDQDAPPPDAWGTALRHVVGLCRVLKIDPDNVVGHSEVDSRKTCPGLRFDMSAFRYQVKQLLGLSDGH